MFSASSELLATVGSHVPFGVRLVSMSRNGGEQLLSPYRQQGAIRLSPDGRRIARSILDPEDGDTDVWIEDLTDGSLVRAIAPGLDVLPVWSPDGRRIAYGSGTRTARRLSIAAADGTGLIQEFACPAAYCEPTDWSPDGRYLIVNTRASMSARHEDVWRVSLEGGDTSAVLSGEFAEYDARLSPDGQWLAYVSLESGRPDVHVRAMSGPPRRIVASSGGGSQPVWRRDGRELLYVDLDGRLQARAVQRDPRGGELALGAAAPLATVMIGSGHWGTQYDVSHDGQRIYFFDRTPLPRPATMNLLLSWQALLKPR